MSKEVITINIGGGGVQSGDVVWKQRCAEYNISQNGIKRDENIDESFTSFFYETESKKYKTRNVMIDLDQNIIENIKTSKYSSIYAPEYLISGQQNAQNNFAKAYHMKDEELLNNISNAIRKCADNCHYLDSFIINHSVGGGTGSGLGQRILEKLEMDYRKIEKIGFEIYPFNNHHSQTDMEIYNAFLSTHCLLEYVFASYIFDNRKLYHLCQDCLNISSPSYNDMNILIAKMESSATKTIGIRDTINSQSHMVEFSRLKFITSSMAPIINDSDIKKIYIKDVIGKTLIDGFVRFHYPINTNISCLQYELPLYEELMNLIYSCYTDKFIDDNKTYYLLDSVNDLFEMCCNSDYFMIECDDYDPEQDVNTGILTICHGEIFGEAPYHNIYYSKPRSNAINKAYELAKKNNKLSWTLWDPTGMKFEYNPNALQTIDNDILISTNSLTMFANNTSISRFFSNRISEKFYSMYCTKKFINLYTKEGMEEDDIEEARENLAFLEKDYLDILVQHSDETD